jgi:2-iminoacetate synthase
LRNAFPAAELVLSTRERPELRNRLAAICITQLSAGSSTVPGGYENGYGACDRDGQFPVHDTRSVEEVSAWCRASGFAVADEKGTSLITTVLSIINQ